MADYQAFARSNYFAVKDPEAFKRFVEGCGATLLTKTHRNFTTYGFYADGIPDLEDPDVVNDVDYESVASFMAELSNYLAEDWVAVVIEIGHEAVHYAIGLAVAVNSEGEVLYLSLDDIFDKACNLGEHITYAEY